MRKKQANEDVEVNSFDPRVPLTWPLHWSYYLDRSIDVHWNVYREVPHSFDDSALLIVCRSGVRYPELVAQGHAKNEAGAREAIESVLYGVNMLLEEHLLRPRIRHNPNSWGVQSDHYIPTPGGRG